MLVLASTSVYRRALLSRLGFGFDVDSPEIDEQALAGESAPQTALRLARAKAEAVAPRHPGTYIIGSDQVAELDGARLGKPGNHERAAEQLRKASGRTVVFHTAVALLHADTGRVRTRLVLTRVVFRPLSDAQIDAYLRREQPYDCAGSAKSEGLGIALLRAQEGEDPTALIGLPLIALVDLLAEEGISVV